MTRSGNDDGRQPGAPEDSADKAGEKGGGNGLQRAEREAARQDGERAGGDRAMARELEVSERQTERQAPNDANPGEGAD